MARHAFVAAFLCAALVVAPAWAQTAGEPGGGEVGNATDLAAEFACKEPPPWGFALGVAMGTVASVGINIGQNMQADGIRKLPEEQRDKEQWRSPLWRYGMGVFITCSIVNFAALALAPASVLVPLESIQFVTNVCYAKFVNKSKVSFKMVLGVALSVVGTVLSVVFGAAGSGCHTLEELEWAWKHSVGWWIFVGVSIIIALICLHINRDYAHRLSVGRPAPGHQFVGPITFTLSSALLGGSQMIVQSKVFSEVLAMLFTGNIQPLKGWLLYVALVLVVLCGMLWVIRLTQCLGLYNPILILPLMVATYILFGGVAGGIYFREFDTLHVGRAGWANWGLYIAGMLCVLLGLYFIATAGIAIEEEKKKSMTKAQQRRGSVQTGKQLWAKARAANNLRQLYGEVSVAQAATLPQSAIASHPALIVASATSDVAVRASQFGMDMMSRFSSRGTLSLGSRNTGTSTYDGADVTAAGNLANSTGSNGSGRANSRPSSRARKGSDAVKSAPMETLAESRDSMASQAEDEWTKAGRGSAAETESDVFSSPPAEIRSETPPSNRPTPARTSTAASVDSNAVVLDMEGVDKSDEKPPPPAAAEEEAPAAAKEEEAPAAAPAAAIKMAKLPTSESV